MAHGKGSTPFEQRLTIWELAQAGQTDGQIAQQLGLGRAVVRKWRRRAQHQGRAGLSVTPGRPRRGVLSHSPANQPDDLRTLRRDHPGWGPITLRWELGQLAQAHGQPRPSRSGIAAFLKAEGLTRPYERHAPLPQPAGPPEPVAHAEWEMDAQGVQVVAGVGRVVVINIGDPYSRLLTESLGCVHTTKPKVADYQLALRRAFLRFGCPQGLSLDHDTSFHDTSASPYPTRLHLWLLALGLTVRFIDLGKPTQHGFIEHEHQIMTHQALEGQPFADPARVQPMLDQRRDFLNRAYPNRALGQQAPLQANPGARHSGQPYSPERETDLLDPQRVYTYLAQQRWFRRVSDKGQFELGTYRYGLGAAWANQTLEIRFDPQTVELVCHSQTGEPTRRLPAKGLTPSDWIGELQPDRLPTYQLAFPWSIPACRMGLLLEDWAGTTFLDNRPAG
jgi:transposase-like protein